MLTEEHEEFDNSVDPYDRSIDRDFDDGIAKGPAYGAPADELEALDEDDWDTVYDDEAVPQAAQTDETADYDALDD